MQLQVKEVKLPEAILFNYEELKAELAEKVHIYETMVYTDDQIKQAKADRADLNKLKKALNDERLRREREYMAPFNDFKGKINEIIAIIDKPVAVIDKQVKAYEEKAKEDKRNEIQTYFDEHARGFEYAAPEWLKLEQIFDEKWLNASANMNGIKESIRERCQQIDTEVKTIQSLPEYSFEALEAYKATLNLSKAIAEGQRLAEIQRRKAEAEALKAQADAAKQEAPAPAPTACQPAEPVDVWQEKAPEKTWVSFRALLTVDEAKALKAFFENNGITFEAVK